MRPLLLALLFLVPQAYAACLNEEVVRDGLFAQTRMLFELTPETELLMVKNIESQELPDEAHGAFLEMLSEDRFFDSPKRKGQCPDRIVRLYQFYGQDSFRRCNGILRAEVVGRDYDVLYRNCGRN